LALSGSYQGNGTTCASDRDGDLVPNCDDPCPDDGAKIDPGICGCGIADDDTDADGVADCLDLCPATSGGEPVDSNGCHLNGACCGPITGCLDDTYVDQAWCDATAGGWIYQGNGTTCALGCLPRQSGDYDADGDVDASDFAALPDCLTGTASKARTFCRRQLSANRCSTSMATATWTPATTPLDNPPPPREMIKTREKTNLRYW
jgi:hypothetical protein